MITHNIFNDIFVIPILNALILFYKGFLALHLPGSFGLAIIALTILVRLILHPLFKKQMETTKKMQELKPELDKLTAKHKKDPKKLQQEQMSLYSQAGINPATGCLLLLVQFPVFIGLYNTLSLFFNNGGYTKALASINSVLYSPALRISTLDLNFLGFNLAQTPHKGGGLYLLIPVVTALLQYLQVQYSTPSMGTADKNTSLEKKDNKDNKENMAGDFQKVMSTQMKYVFPLMIGFFSYNFSAGLALYWNIFSIFSIIQFRRHTYKS